VVGLLALTALPGWSPGQQEPAKPKPAAPATAPPLPATPAAPVQPSPDDGPPVGVPVQAAPATQAPAISNVPPPVPGTSFDFGFPGVQQNDPDARLKAIEQQLQALLKEVRGMRSGGPNKAGGLAAVPHAPARAATSSNPYFHPPRVTTPPGLPTAGTPLPASQGGEVMLSRVTYELPSDKSKALSDLFQDTKNPEVTVKIEDGDNVTVTTTPEAQHVIGQFIHFLQGKPITAPHSYYQIQNGTAVPVTTYQAVPAKR